MHPRRLARESILGALYAFELTGEEQSKVLSDLFDRNSFDEDIPPKVSISEAIEIAKVYSTEDSSSFVNGVLDSIYKRKIDPDKVVK